MKLEKKYTKTEEIDRRQLNFTCYVDLISRLKILAHRLDTPFYHLAEHALELGMCEIAIKLQDKALAEIAT